MNNNNAMRLVALTMMSMMGLFASDIYIPGLHDIAHSLGRSYPEIQLTIGVYLLGLAVFQLVHGPLSDRFGRRNVILAGFTIYTLASLGCALSTTFASLLMYRFLQAVGACSGLVVGRAIINDLYKDDEAIKAYNIIYPLVSASPALAPLLGGYLIHYIGWRAPFLFVALFGTILLYVTYKYIPETNSARASTTNPSQLIKAYAHILLNIRFVVYCTMICAIYGAWFTYLSIASIIYSKMGYLSQTIGYFYIPLSMAIFIGSHYCKKLLNELDSETCLFIGLVLFTIGASIMVISAYFTPVNHALYLIVPMCIVASANGFILPVAIPKAISMSAKHAGAASGLVGCLQIGAASLATSCIGSMFGISAKIMSLSIFCMAVTALTLFVILQAKYRGFNFKALGAEQ